MASDQTSKPQTPGKTPTRNDESQPAKERRAVYHGPLTAAPVLPKGVKSLTVRNRVEPENLGRRKTDLPSS